MNFPIYEHYHQAWYPVDYVPSLSGRIWWEDLQTSFKQDGYVKIPQLVPADYAQGPLTSHYWENKHLHQRWSDMEGIKRTSANDLPMMTMLHHNLQKITQYIVDEPIKSSYSFASAYETGSSLPVHTDRSQCVYNISLMLSGDGDLSEWPLFVKHAETTNRVKLNAGDAVLYSGTKDPHWRDPMPSSLNSVLGLFLHFVPVNFTGSLA